MVQPFLQYDSSAIRVVLHQGLQILVCICCRYFIHPQYWQLPNKKKLVLSHAACSAVSCRSAFSGASKHDQTGGLAKTLAWSADNGTAFFVLLYIAFGVQVCPLQMVQQRDALSCALAHI